MQNVKETIECDLHDLLLEQDEYNEKLSHTNNTIHTLEEALKNARINGDARIRALVETCIKSSEKLVTRATAENDVAVAAGTSAYFMLFGEELIELLGELSKAHESYVSDSYNNVEALARKCILMGHLMATVYIQGNTICKTSANIERGESKFRCFDFCSLFFFLIILTFCTKCILCFLKHFHFKRFFFVFVKKFILDAFEFASAERMFFVFVIFV